MSQRVTLAELTVPLTREEVNVLLYVLDDADRVAVHHRADEILEMWRRLNFARIWADGDRHPFHRPEDRVLAITPSEALLVWLVVTPDWIDELHSPVAAPMRRLRDRLRPSTLATANA